MTEMTSAEIAKSILDVGLAWSKARGIPEAKGVIAFLELMADGQIECFREGSEIYWCLRGARCNLLENPINEIPI